MLPRCHSWSFNAYRVVFVTGFGEGRCDLRRLCPRTCVEIRFSQPWRLSRTGTRGSSCAPGDHSPLEAGYIFADCFSSNPISLAVRRRTIHISLTRNRWSNSQDSFSTDWEKARAAVWNRAPADEPAFLPKRQLPTNKAEAGPERGCMAFRSPLVTLRRPRRTENIQAGARA